ncbi:hypothetical protein Golax_017115 [Gossypium laxum]|uniref:Uncharacterized protein n=1 Tax=Gossypium laxum TaxID=34288 RepID=A0A7J8YZ89_9ROSI|nr:hypothetical protein [Gossypium laxum]
MGDFNGRFYVLGRKPCIMHLTPFKVMYVSLCRLIEQRCLMKL